MELVMLKNVDKQGLLACVDTKNKKNNNKRKKSAV